MAKKRVVLTGAAGYVAQRMLDALRARFDLVLLDAVATTRDGRAVPGMHVVDLTNEDRDRYRHLFRGADAVIHCAFIRPPRDDDWKDTSDVRFRAEYANVGMAYNVYRTALEEGVRRLLVCSSNHAADYYERLWMADKVELVTPEMPARSDNFYGWSKASYELLGFVFATGAVDGRKLEIVQWRIGAPRDDDMDRIAPGDTKGMHRALGATCRRATRRSRRSAPSRPSASRTCTACPTWSSTASAATRIGSGAWRARGACSAISPRTTARRDSRTA
jgi:hypothetical protein